MLRHFSPGRSLALLAFLTWALVFSLSPRDDLLDHTVMRTSVPRAILPLPDPATSNSGAGGVSATVSNPSGTVSSATPTITSQPVSPPTSSTPTPPTSSSISTTDSNTSPSTPLSTPSSTPPPTITSAPPSEPTSSAVSVSAFSSTNVDGEVTVIFTTVTPSQTSSSSSASPSVNSDQDTSSGSSKGVGTSTIVGLSVAGGIALFGIIGFIIWKLTRKRFSDDFDDSV
ncbi:hypothetical protein BC835DRAFT_485395 [Cytidiella melzeri]|nr:hypothetical protein BC835DRAFT_485395 [Cytidiella melzeri]